jgi:hypothetical protein
MGMQISEPEHNMEGRKTWTRRRRKNGERWFTSASLPRPKIFQQINGTKKRASASTFEQEELKVIQDGVLTDDNDSYGDEMESDEDLV